jgi:hypothetical protein
MAAEQRLGMQEVESVVGESRAQEQVVRFGVGCPAGAARRATGGVRLHSTQPELPGHRTRDRVLDAEQLVRLPIEGAAPERVVR